MEEIMIDAFAKTGIAKWNTETLEYEPYELPENCPLTLPPSELETEINCASCHKKAIFGKCYTSKEIHGQHGFGFPVCEDCYNKELEKK
jgi:hypothetical protein